MARTQNERNSSTENESVIDGAIERFGAFSAVVRQPGANYFHAPGRVCARASSFDSFFHREQRFRKEQGKEMGEESGRETQRESARVSVIMRQYREEGSV